MPEIEVDFDKIKLQELPDDIRFAFENQSVKY